MLYWFHFWPLIHLVYQKKLLLLSLVKLFIFTRRGILHIKVNWSQRTLWKRALLSFRLLPFLCVFPVLANFYTVQPMVLRGTDNQQKEHIRILYPIYTASQSWILLKFLATFACMESKPLQSLHLLSIYFHIKSRYDIFYCSECHLAFEGS